MLNFRNLKNKIQAQFLQVQVQIWKIPSQFLLSNQTLHDIIAQAFPSFLSSEGRKLAFCSLSVVAVEAVGWFWIQSRLSLISFLRSRYHYPPPPSHQNQISSSLS